MHTYDHQKHSALDTYLPMGISKVAEGYAGTSLCFIHANVSEHLTKLLTRTSEGLTFQHYCKKNILSPLCDRASSLRPRRNVLALCAIPAGDLAWRYECVLDLCTPKWDHPINQKVP